jgi:DNA-binding PadR family transcriptional regulator
MNKYLSRPEEIILLAVMKLSDNAYGVSIRKMVQELTGKYWSIGAVYVPLERLEQKGYVKSFSSKPLSERGGRRKRLFRITLEGIKELEKIRRMNQIIWEDYSSIPLKER